MGKKNYNIELLRIIACIMVIGIHVTNYWCRAYGQISNYEYVFSLIINIMSRVSVPCFFLITGYFLLSREDDMKKSMQRVLHIFIALAVWSAVYYFFNIYYMNTPVELTKILSVPTEKHLWYLYVLIPIYLVMPFLQRMSVRMDDKLWSAFLLIGTGWFVVALILMLTKTSLYYGLPLYGDKNYMFYIILGGAVARWEDKIPKKKGLWISLYIGCSMLTVIAVFIDTLLQGIHAERLQAYGSPLVMIASLSLFILMLQANSIKESPFVKGFAACTFGIYLSHIVFLDMFKKEVLPTEFSGWIGIPVLIVGITAISWGLIYLIRLIKIGRKIT